MTTPAPTPKKLRLVIGDDSSIMRNRLRQHATAAGCIVVGEASNANMAYTVAKKLRPDIALLDILMRPGSGKETALRLKSEQIVRDVVVISSNSQDFIKAPLTAVGIEWLTKPVDDEQILRFMVDLVKRIHARVED